MLKRLLMSFCLLSSFAPLLHAQAGTTASRRFDLQGGVLGVLGTSDYEPIPPRGYGAFVTLDFTSHFGNEVNFKQLNSRNGDQLYERTYEIGGRYHRNYGIFEPYVRLSVGRAVFNYPRNVANIAYNMFSGGAGTDVRVYRNITVRADYEYQDWRGFPPNGLTPQPISFGIGYHFPGNLKRGRHF